MQFKQNLALAVTLVLFANSPFAAVYEAIFDTMLVTYDSRNAQVEVHSFEHDAPAIKQRGTIVVGGNMRVKNFHRGPVLRFSDGTIVETKTNEEAHMTGSFSGSLGNDGITINNVFMTPDIIKEKCLEQQGIINQNIRRSSEESISLINNALDVANKYLLLIASVSHQSKTILTSENFNSLIALFSDGTNKEMAIVLLLEKATFLSLTDVCEILKMLNPQALKNSTRKRIQEIIASNYPLSLEFFDCP